MTISEKIYNLLFLAINKTPYTKKILANLGIKKTIAYAQKIGLYNFDHYRGQYWNEFDTVQRYINQNATGNSDTIWQKDILSRFSEYVPFEKCLVIGCGNGWVERELYDLKVGLDFDAFDISEKYLTVAKQKKGDRKIRYFQADLDNLKDLPVQKYDAIFNVGVLHHGFRISRTVWYLCRALKPSGLMFNFDYVGPAQNNYSDKHFQVLKDINSQLPKRFQTPYRLRPSKEDAAFGDPTEAIHADLVRPVIKRFFDIVYERNINGGIGYPILLNNTKEFHKYDSDARLWLEKILEYDREYTEKKKVPVLFWYGVGKPKEKKDIKNYELLP